MIEPNQLQLFAGTVASLIFAGGTLSMLRKAKHTHDVKSYSVLSLLLNNIGNLVYWVYIFSLPFGPIYFLHGFYTVAMLLMLIWYFSYHRQSRTNQASKKRTTQTMEMSPIHQ